MSSSFLNLFDESARFVKNKERCTPGNRSRSFHKSYFIPSFYSFFMIYSKGSQARFGAEIENTITVMLNGSSIAFDQPPIIKDDRTLVPVRAISAAFDYQVDWNDELQQVSIAN